MAVSMALKVALSVALMAGLSSAALAQSETAEFWPGIDAHVQLSENVRMLAFVGLKKGEDFAQQELNAGLGVGYQWKKITKPHPENIDPEKEHLFSFGGGYERLDTVQSGTSSYENRMVPDPSPCAMASGPNLLALVSVRWGRS